MKIRLTLTNGQTIDFEAPENFNFVGWIASVRESGRWLIPQVYVPAEHIISVLILDQDGQPIEIKGTIQ